MGDLLPFVVVEEEESRIPGGGMLWKTQSRVSRPRESSTRNQSHLGIGII